MLPPTALHLTRRGAVWQPEAAATLKAAFEQQQCVKLRSLLSADLVAAIQTAITRSTFRERSHGTLASELCLEDGVCTGLLHFLINDPRLFRLVEQIAGCSGIRSFGGRIYRRHPGGQHYDHWHGDLADPRRLVGLSVKLSTEIYEGGVFEIRDLETEHVFAHLPNVGLGDAILFRLSPALEHRVSDMRGAYPKTAFAGWFLAEKDFEPVLHQVSTG